MISAPHFVDRLSGFGPYLGVPCSYLTPFINYVIDHAACGYHAANNEGEAVAMAAGAWLAGRSPVVMLQNSGLGNIVNPVTSLLYPFRIPLLLIVTWRGEPGRPDEPQHELMGRTTASLLDLMEVRHAPFPSAEEDVDAAVAVARAHLQDSGRPFAFVMSRGAVAPYPLKTPPPATRERQTALVREALADALLSRSAALEVMVDAVGGDALLIATTGKTGRELFTRADEARNLYVVGSMGCASSIGLGLALHAPHRRVVVIDGDGAALMRLEAMAGVGAHAPKNLVHVILDNQVHDSTGGQSTLSPWVDFATVAAGCGYASAASVSTAVSLRLHLERAAAANGPHLIHLRIRPGSPADLGRPTVSPHEIARRFRAAVGGPVCKP